MKVLKFAAIDVGSNAVRLLIKDVITSEDAPPFFKKVSLIRIPIRLGQDVFKTKKISERNYSRMISALKAYKHLMKAHEVIGYRACATSAMREAENGPALRKEILSKTGLDLEIISGSEEAKILYSNGIANQLEPNKPYLYIDVGGGSTELTYFFNNQIIASKSFKIGTVRLLNNQVKEKTWEQLFSWTQKHSIQFQNLSAIGTGGNINKIFKLTNHQYGEYMSTDEVVVINEELTKMTMDERIRKYNMKVDRADVIVPASLIFKNALQWSKSQRIFVPKVGLSDGIIIQLYNEHIQNQ